MVCTCIKCHRVGEPRVPGAGQVPLGTPRLTDEGIEAGDPDVSLVWMCSHQIQRLKLLAVDYGEGTFFTVRPAELFVPKDRSVLSGPNLLDGIDGYWNRQAGPASHPVGQCPSD